MKGNNKMKKKEQIRTIKNEKKSEFKANHSQIMSKLRLDGSQKVADNQKVLIFPGQKI